MPCPKPTPILLSDLERDCLESISRCTSKPYRLIQRAQLILLAAQGHSNTAIAEQIHPRRRGVREWRFSGYRASQQWSQDIEVEKAIAPVALD